MSTMLEQAIVDAQSLREAALKDAETALLEKYATEVKQSVAQILEQDEDQVELDIGSGDDEVSIMADLPDAHDPETGDEEVVVLDLDQIIAAADAEDGDEEYEMDAQEIADEVGIDIVDDAPANRDDELDISESALVDIFQEMLKVDLDHHQIETIEKYDEEALEEEDEALAIPSVALDAGMDVEDSEERDRLRTKADVLQKENKELKNILARVKDKLQEVNFANARLLYANNVLGDNSLNEQQKNKIVDMISEARSVDEAKMVFETLQKTMAQTAPRRSPQSLSEAVSRRSSVILSGHRKEETTEQDPGLNRWAVLAGIKNK
jgi:hypothetical protein